MITNSNKRKNHRHLNSKNVFCRLTNMFCQTFFLLIFLCGFPVPFSASPALAKSDLDKLTSVLNRYRSAAMVSIDFRQVIAEDLTGKKSETYGELNVAKGLLRLQTNKPEKTLVVLDGIYLWNEQAKAIDFAGPVQVTKVKIEKQGKSQLFFRNVLTGEPLSKSFKLSTVSQDKQNVLFRGESLDKSSPIKKINLKIDLKANQISEMSYQDDIGNETQLFFLKTNFLSELKKNIFIYKPPKGAQVTEI